MVGSPFIQINRHDRRRLLNSSQIVAVYTEDFDLTTRRGQLLYDDYDHEVGMLYTVQLLLTSRREMEYVFADKAERDSMYEELLQLLTPSATISIASPFVERSDAHQAANAAKRRAQDEAASHAAGMAAVEAKKAQQQATPPTAPPRKPRKPKE